MSRLNASRPGFSATCLMRTVAVLLQVCLMSAARAQTLDYGTFETLFEEPVTTSVTGSPQRASEVPASMKIITADDIRRSGARDIPGVLRHVTGLNVTRWTNSGADVSIRGYNSVFTPRLLVMINNRQVYADHYGYVPWSTLPVTMEEIRQIEIVKGPNSALFGFNAVGGVINIITVSPMLDDVDAVSLLVGTQDLVEGGATLTMHPRPGTGIRFSLRGRRNDDFSTPLPPVSTGIRKGDESRSGSFDAHVQPREDVLLELEGSWSRADQTNMVPSYLMGFEETTVRSLKGAVHADTAYGLVEFSAYHNGINNDAYIPVTLDGVNFLVPETPNASFDNDVTVVRLQDTVKPAAAHTLRISAEYRQSSLGTTPVAGAEISYDVVSAGGMWRWELTEAFSLTGALRVDRLTLQREGIIPEDFFLSNTDWDRRLNEPSFNLGLVWHVGDYSTVRLVAARGVQLPSLYNLGGSLFRFELPPELGPPSVGYIAGVPTLSPTTVDNVELAWSHDFSNLDATLNLAWFLGKTRDVIADTGDSDLPAGILSQPANIGKSDTNGFEVSLEGNAGENWRWDLGYVYQRIDDVFGARYFVESTLTNFEATTPRHIVNAGLGWARGPWELDAYIRYESGTRNLRSPADFFNPRVLFPIDDFVILDARVSYRVNDSLSVELAGKNLLKDEQIQHTAPAVERSIQMGVNVAF